MSESIWFREWSNGDCELGILEERYWGPVMNVGDFAYYFHFDLSKWTRIGKL